jgi:hypothetical protein
MRVEDPNGEWRVSDGDERLMVPARPDEAEPGAAYYRLYKEGVFKDYDGFERKIARPFHGLDMNRQYPYRWREDADQGGAGPYPLSEPESRAHVDALLARKNVFSIHSHHTFCGAILRPYSDRDDKEMPDHDLAVYKAIGDRGTEITGYPNISVYHDFRYEEDKFITGAFDDWAFDYYGVFAFTVEFWSLPAAAGVEVKDFIEFFRDPPEEASLKMLSWNDRELEASVLTLGTPTTTRSSGASRSGLEDQVYPTRTRPRNSSKRSARSWPASPSPTPRPPPAWKRTSGPNNSPPTCDGWSCAWRTPVTCLPTSPASPPTKSSSSPSRRP